jgi:hypothetical protein
MFAKMGPRSAKHQRDHVIDQVVNVNAIIVSMHFKYVSALTANVINLFTQYKRIILYLEQIIHSQQYFEIMMGAGALNVMKTVPVLHQTLWLELCAAKFSEVL